MGCLQVRVGTVCLFQNAKFLACFGELPTRLINLFCISQISPYDHSPCLSYIEFKLESFHLIGE